MYPPTTPYGYPPQPYANQYGYPPNRSRTGPRVVVVVLVVFFLLIGFGVAAGVLAARDSAGTSQSAVPPGNSDPFNGNDPLGGNDPFGNNPLGGNDPFGFPGTATVDPGQSADQLPLGRAVNISDPDGSWTVTINSATWRSTDCDPAALPLGQGVRMLVVNVTFAVTKGVAEVNPLDFQYTDPNGVPALPAILSSCGPELQSGFDLPAGTKRTGAVAFEVRGKGGGLIGYSALFSPIATWQAPA
jgi:hypothetical protein